MEGIYIVDNFAKRKQFFNKTQGVPNNNTDLISFYLMYRLIRAFSKVQSLKCDV